MKLVVKQQDLARGLSIVGHAVSTRTTLPILSNILIATEGDRVKLSATNLEIGITATVPATVQEEGQTTLPARLLTEFVSSLPQGDVKLELQPGGAQAVKVSGQRSQATIRGMDPAEFPTIPTAEGGAAPVVVGSGELRQMIREVAFAAATDDARPVFTGVLVRVRDGRLTLAAADSFRIAVRHGALSGSGAGDLGEDVLVPARTLNELGRILPDEGEVKMVVTPNRNQVLFRSESAQLDLVSNLIAGKFPNFEAILPKSSSTVITGPTEEFRSAARRAAIFGRDSSNIVRLTVRPGENGGLEPAEVTLAAAAEESGDTTSIIDEARTDGPGLEIIFNVKYLTDVLGVIDTDRVRIELNTPQQPGAIRRDAAEEERSLYTYVIMPMHSTR